MEMAPNFFSFVHVSILMRSTVPSWDLLFSILLSLVDAALYAMEAAPTFIYFLFWYCAFYWVGMTPNFLCSVLIYSTMPSTESKWHIRSSLWYSFASLPLTEWKLHIVPSTRFFLLPFCPLLNWNVISFSLPFCPSCMMSCSQWKRHRPSSQSSAIPIQWKLQLPSSIPFIPLPIERKWHMPSTVPVIPFIIVWTLQ